jgi:hypothetical protein
MCDPVSMGIAMAAGAGLSLMGTLQQGKAAQQAQQAIANQNRMTQLAQNQGFTQRINAGVQQTQAQGEAMRQTLEARDTSATQMRRQQQDALQGFQDTINAENQRAEEYRQAGDQASRDLLAKTSANAQVQQQNDRQQQAMALVQQGQDSQPAGPAPTDPNSGVQDPVTRAALARRTAEAATNVRDYGSKIARVGSYSAVPQETGAAIAANRAGIMPAQFADKLLHAGSDVRLLPSRVNYSGATQMGQAYDTLFQSRGQNALDAAGLSYGNATDLANLSQSNTTTIAANEAAQAKANAEAAASRGRIISGIGNLALQGGSYYGGFGGLSSLFGGPTSNAALQSYGVQSGPNNPFTTYRS